MASYDVMAWLENYRRGTDQVPATEPEEVSCWTRSSVNEGSKMTYGDRSGLLGFTGCPTVGSLKDGYPKDFVRKTEDLKVCGVEVVLCALRHNGTSLSECDVVSFRNNFNKVFLTPLELKKEWVVDACMLTGLPTMFLDIQNCEQESYPDEDLFMYYGYKFENLCTGQTGLVDSTSEFGMVVSSTVGNIRLLMGCEVDCYDPSAIGEGSKAQLKDCLELKTSRFPAAERQQQNVQRFKYPKWWLQSFLGGIRRIVVGYWETDGNLRKTETLDTHALPELALQGLRGYIRKQIWHPDQMLAFGVEVLTWMMSSCAECKDQHLRFKFVPGSKLIKYEVVADGDLASRVSGLVSAGGWKGREQDASKPA